MPHQPGAIAGQPVGQRPKRGAGTDREGQGVVHRRADQHPFGIGLNKGTLGRLAAPPGRNIGQLQGLAQKGFADARQEGQHRPGLDHTRPKRVHKAQRAFPQGLEQTGGADM